MSNRFVEWVTLTARENDLRVQMLLLAALAIGLYLSVQAVPVPWRPVGRTLIIILLGVTYVGLFAFALWTLVDGLHLVG